MKFSLSAMWEAVPVNVAKISDYQFYRPTLVWFLGNYPTWTMMVFYHLRNS